MEKFQVKFTKGSLQTRTTKNPIKFHMKNVNKELNVGKWSEKDKKFMLLHKFNSILKCSKILKEIQQNCQSGCLWIIIT